MQASKQGKKTPSKTKFKQGHVWDVLDIRDIGANGIVCLEVPLSYRCLQCPCILLVTYARVLVTRVSCGRPCCRCVVLSMASDASVLSGWRRHEGINAFTFNVHATIKRHPHNHKARKTFTLCALRYTFHIRVRACWMVAWCPSFLCEGIALFFAYCDCSCDFSSDWPAIFVSEATGSAFRFAFQTSAGIFNWWGIVLSCVVLYFLVLILFCLVLSCVILCCLILCVLLCCAALCCIVLCCVAFVVWCQVVSRRMMWCGGVVRAVWYGVESCVVLCLVVSSRLVYLHTNRTLFALSWFTT